MADKYRPLKDAFGRFATGIAVATCPNADGTSSALTINSFTSVSLEPPLVLWCLENKASTYDAFMASECYGVSILRSDQRAVSDHFARVTSASFGPDEVEYWETGAPILKTRLAGFDCKIVARHGAGDHVVLVGEILRFHSEHGAPLIYFASAYGAGTEV